MPIKLLKDIKISAQAGSEYLNRQEFQNAGFVSSPLFDAYIFSCGDMKCSQPLFNDGVPTLIIMPKISDIVEISKSGQVLTLKSAWLCCGIINDTHWLLPKELAYIIVIRFRPSSFYSIFQLSPLVFEGNSVCNFLDIVSPDWSDILNLMYQREFASDRMLYLASVFSVQYTSEHLPPLIQDAIDYVNDQKGNISVADLLSKLGNNVNHKWLQRNFIKYIGIAPKKYISLHRFIYTFGKFEEQSCDVLDAVVSGGYYDYNHFIKDFKQYLGASPSRITLI